MAIENLPYVKHDKLDEKLRSFTSLDDVVRFIEGINAKLKIRNPVLGSFINKQAKDSNDPEHVSKLGYIICHAFEAYGIPEISKNVVEASFISHASKEYKKAMDNINLALKQSNPYIWGMIDRMAEKSIDPEAVRRTAFGVCALIGAQIEANNLDKAFGYGNALDKMPVLEANNPDKAFSYGNTLDKMPVLKPGIFDLYLRQIKTREDLREFTKETKNMIKEHNPAIWKYIASLHNRAKDKSGVLVESYALYRLLQSQLDFSGQQGAGLPKVSDNVLESFLEETMPMQKKFVEEMQAMLKKENYYVWNYARVKSKDSAFPEDILMAMYGIYKLLELQIKADKKH